MGISVRNSKSISRSDEAWCSLILLLGLLLFVLLVISFLFFLLFLWFLFFVQSLDVGSNNAKEVSEESINAACDIEGNDYFLLLGGLDESNTIISSDNRVLLVKEDEVAGTPDCNKGNSDNGKDAGNSHL